MDVLKKIRNDIKVGVERYGKGTPEYFAYIRKLSIRYWLFLNREEIFDELHRKKS